MIVPVLLLLLSLAVAGYSLWLDFPQLSGSGLAGFAGVVAAILLLRRRRPAAPAQRWVVVDGSNVLYWGGAGPDLAVL